MPSQGSENTLFRLVLVLKGKNEDWSKVVTTLQHLRMSQLHLLIAVDIPAHNLLLPKGRGLPRTISRRFLLLIDPNARY